jgi:uncharacterized protein YjbJ (UPF0337 family)
MKSLPWIIAGVGIGLATYVLINQPGPQYAGGYDDVEDAADKTAFWGSKQRVKGTGGSLVGKAKEGFGRATGNDDLAGEGLVDQAVGTVKDTAGKAANAVGKTIHDLNQ